MTERKIFSISSIWLSFSAIMACSYSKSRSLPACCANKSKAACHWRYSRKSCNSAMRRLRTSSSFEAGNCVISNRASFNLPCLAKIEARRDCAWMMPRWVFSFGALLAIPIYVCKDASACLSWPCSNCKEPKSSQASAWVGKRCVTLRACSAASSKRFASIKTRTYAMG